MKQDIVTIVCDKRGRTLRSRGAYGFAHQCGGHMREINEQFKKAITFASNREEIRRAYEVRAYANAMYSPGHEDFYQIRNVI